MYFYYENTFLTLFISLLRLLLSKAVQVKVIRGYINANLGYNNKGYIKLNFRCREVALLIDINVLCVVLKYQTTFYSLNFMYNTHKGNQSKYIRTAINLISEMDAVRNVTCYSRQHVIEF